MRPISMPSRSHQTDSRVSPKRELALAEGLRSEVPDFGADGNPIYRYRIRYDQLFAFLIATTVSAEA